MVNLVSEIGIILSGPLCCTLQLTSTRQEARIGSLGERLICESRTDQGVVQSCSLERDYSVKSFVVPQNPSYPGQEWTV